MHFGHIALDFYRLINAGERFLDLRKLLQDKCAAEIGFGKFWFKRDRAVVVGQRLGVAAEVDEGVSTIAVGQAEIRIERDRLVVAGNCLFGATGRMEGRAAIEPVARRIRIK